MDMKVASVYVGKFSVENGEMYHAKCRISNDTPPRMQNFRDFPGIYSWLNNIHPSLLFNQVIFRPYLKKNFEPEMTPLAEKEVENLESLCGDSAPFRVKHVPYHVVDSISAG